MAIDKDGNGVVVNGNLRATTGITSDGNLRLKTGGNTVTISNDAVSGLNVSSGIVAPSIIAPNASHNDVTISNSINLGGSILTGNASGNLSIASLTTSGTITGLLKELRENGRVAGD